MSPFKAGRGEMFRLLLLVFSAFILTRCAQESAPTGGKQDQEPPRAKKISPPDKSIHFRSSKIEITFNEFIKETGFSQTLISPVMDKRPDFKVSGKTLTIKLKSPLSDSTTYTINFADDIKDLNEGNTASNFTYVFSTGNFIDSQEVYGNVLLAKDNTPAENIVVALYPLDSTDGILNSKPVYFAKTDKSGEFEIKNVKTGGYNIYALKDQNYNYLYDQPNELIAFSDSLIDLNDSVFKKITLLLFDEKKGKLKVDEVRSISPGQLKISYTKPINSLKINGNLASDDDFYWFYDSKDSLTYWYSKYYIDRTSLFLAANDTLLDTVRMDLKYIANDSLLAMPQNFLGIVNQTNTSKERKENKEVFNIQELYKALKIEFTRPITGINETKSLHITEDTTGKVVDGRFYLDEKTKQFVFVEFDKRENTAYSVEIPDSMFQDLFKTWNKNLTYKFRTNSKDAYGNLHITLKTNQPENSYVVKLLNAGNEPVKEFFLSGDAEKKVSVENILSGSYKFLVIEDRNKNGKWDTGNFADKIQPEKMFLYKDTYQLKGGWDLDVEVKF